MANKFAAAALVLAVVCTAAWGQGIKLGDIQKGLKVIDAGKKAASAMQPIGPKEEKMIGKAVAGEVFARYGRRVEDPGLNRYVTLVGKTVASNSARPEMDYKFAIINNPEPNAFATPGGYIFITTGLMASLKTESQLAGVLGHEVAHAAKKHMLETIQRAKQLSGLTQLTAAALDKDPKMLSQIVNIATDTLFTKGLDKNYEFDADKSGTAYAANSGYDAKGLNEFLRELKKGEGKSGSIFYTTHPSTGARIAKLEKETLPKFKPGQILAERFIANVR